MSLNIVIIGANRGIGFELCRQYSQAGHKVFATCRQASEALNALNCEVLEGIDVADDKLADALDLGINCTHIDVLIHNAGILETDSYPHINLNTMQSHFNINTLGPLRTVMALEHKLAPGSKIGIVTSRVGSIEDNTSSNNYAYRVSKTAANMVGKCLSLDLAEKSIAVALLHPGYVRTEMTSNNGLIDADESAQGLIARMEELSMQNTGIFVHTSGEVLSW